MRRFLRRRLGRPETLLNHPRLQWLGPTMRHPRLWHFGRRAVALGASIGTCIGILIPLGQIPIAAVAAVALRAHLPTAILGTFITNWFTYIPIYLLAYALGCLVTGTGGVPGLIDAFQAGGVPAAFELLKTVPHPWMLLLPFAVGISLMSAVAALLSFLGVHGFWIYQVRREWRRRSPRPATAA
jgi:uncharacterized protein (DUF2062 family)